MLLERRQRSYYSTYIMSHITSRLIGNLKKSENLPVTFHSSPNFAWVEQKHLIETHTILYIDSCRFEWNKKKTIRILLLAECLRIPIRWASNPAVWAHRFPLFYLYILFFLNGEYYFEIYGCLMSCPLLNLASHGPNRIFLQASETSSNFTWSVTYSFVFVFTYYIRKKN